MSALSVLAPTGRVASRKLHRAILLLPEVPLHEVPLGKTAPLGLEEMEGRCVMQALFPCTCIRGKYALHGMRFLRTATKSEEVIDGVFETTLYYVFKLTCVLCRQERKVKGNIEDGTLDEILDLVLPHSAKYREMKELGMTLQADE